MKIWSTGKSCVNWWYIPEMSEICAKARRPNPWAEIDQFFLCTWPWGPAPWPYQYIIASGCSTICMFFFCPQEPNMWQREHFTFTFHEEASFVLLKIAHFILFAYIIHISLFSPLNWDLTSLPVLSCISDLYIAVQSPCSRLVSILSGKCIVFKCQPYIMCLKY